MIHYLQKKYVLLLIAAIFVPIMIYLIVGGEGFSKKRNCTKTGDGSGTFNCDRGCDFINEKYDWFPVNKACACNDCYKCKLSADGQCVDADSEAVVKTKKVLIGEYTEEDRAIAASTIKESTYKPKNYFSSTLKRFWPF